MTNKIKNEIKVNILAEIRDEIKDKLKQEIKHEIKNDIRNEIIEELRKEIRDEIFAELKDELIGDSATQPGEIEKTDDAPPESSGESSDQANQEDQEEQLEQGKQEDQGGQTHDWGGLESQGWDSNQPPPPAMSETQVQTDEPLKVPLESYIRRAYGQPLDTVFTSGSGHQTPMLRRDRMNRILVYPGAFNPPHKGHYEILRHAMFNSGVDMNFVAAFIEPRDDSFVHKKRDQAFVLELEKRCSLWNEGPQDWYWVYERGDDESYEFRSRLKDLFKQDNIPVTFVCLIGPDYVSVNKTLDYKPCKCREIIVSEGSRDCDFVTRSSDGITLEKVLNYEDWKQTTPDRSIIESIVDEGMEAYFAGQRMMRPSQTTAMLKNSESSSLNSLINADNIVEPSMYQKMREDRIEELMKNAEKNYICTNTKHSDRTILFIPRDSECPDVSATKIRNIIKNYSGTHEELVEELKPLALNVEKMLEWSGMLSQPATEDNATCENESPQQSSPDSTSDSDTNGLITPTPPGTPAEAEAEVKAKANKQPERSKKRGGRKEHKKAGKKH